MTLHMPPHDDPWLEEPEEEPEPSVIRRRSPMLRLERAVIRLEDALDDLDRARSFPGVPRSAPEPLRLSDNVKIAIFTLFIFAAGFVGGLLW